MQPSLPILSMPIGRRHSYQPPLGGFGERESLRIEESEGAYGYQRMGEEGFTESNEDPHDLV